MLKTATVVTNKKIGATSEDWFKLKGKPLIEKMREKKGSELGFFDYLQFALGFIWLVFIAIVLIQEVIVEWISYLINKNN